ncbi:MAG: Mobile element protein [Ktedonobacterales bacterium]|nr:MAG: Mobile element protein [Ktedonobacterales bacterium]
MRAMAEDDLIVLCCVVLHFGMGMSIRDEFGLWGGNEALLETCAEVSGCPSEIMTILNLFQASGYRTFQGFSTQQVQVQLRAEFPQLVSSTRFVALLPRMLLPLTVYLHTPNWARVPASALSTPPRWASATMRVSRNITSFGPMRGVARPRSAGSTASSCIWWSMTGANCWPSASPPATWMTAAPCLRPVPRLVRRLFGKLFGDRGYISQPLAEHLLVEPGIQLVTTLRKNMRERLLAATDTLLLRKRAIIESINDQRKNVCQIDIPAITARSTSSFTCWLVSLPTATSPRNRRCISTATSWPGQGPSLSRIYVNTTPTNGTICGPLA